MRFTWNLTSMRFRVEPMTGRTAKTKLFNGDMFERSDTSSESTTGLVIIFLKTFVQEKI